MGAPRPVGGIARSGMYLPHTAPHTPCRQQSHNAQGRARHTQGGARVSEHSSWRPEAPGLGVTWGGQPFHARRAVTIAAAAAVMFGRAAPVAAQAASTAEPVPVIVRELDGAGNAPERAVEALGGT